MSDDIVSETLDVPPVDGRGPDRSDGQPEGRDDEMGLGPVDRPRIEAAVREILAAIGEDPERDGLLDTPGRVARMYEEVFAGLRESPAPSPRRAVRGRPRRDGHGP